MLAEEDATKLDLHLWSAAEQRIPHAARQRFFTQRLKEYFNQRALDLAPYLSDLPPGSFIYGPPAVVDRIEAHLMRELARV